MPEWVWTVLLFLVFGSCWSLFDIRRTMDHVSETMDQVAETCGDISSALERIETANETNPPHEAIVDVIEDLKRTLKPDNF